MKNFDPLLFNGLGSERERRCNHSFYGLLVLFGYAFGMIGGSSVLYGIVTKKYYQDWFLYYYIIALGIVAIYVILWFYIHILLLKNGRKNKNINKDNPLLICEYQGNFKNYCVWSLGFIIMFVFYFIFLVLSIFSLPFLCLVLLHLFDSKPFLLKRILLFEEYVILEYRIFGNIKLNRDNLTLIRLGRLIDKSIMDYTANIAFVRPMIVKNTKNPYLVYFPCIIFIPFGMTNINTLWQELDSKMGYSAEEIAKENFPYAQKKISFKILTIHFKDDFNV